MLYTLYAAFPDPFSRRESGEQWRREKWGGSEGNAREGVEIHRRRGHGMENDQIAPWRLTN